MSSIKSATGGGRATNLNSIRGRTTKLVVTLFDHGKGPKPPQIGNGKGVFSLLLQGRGGETLDWGKRTKRPARNKKKDETWGGEPKFNRSVYDERTNTRQWKKAACYRKWGKWRTQRGGGTTPIKYPLPTKKKMSKENTPTRL